MLRKNYINFSSFYENIITDNILYKDQQCINEKDKSTHEKYNFNRVVELNENYDITEGIEYVRTYFNEFCHSYSSGKIL